MSKRVYILGVLLLFVAGVTSCRYNELEPEDNASAGVKPGQKSGKLEFVIGTAKTVSTKSGDAMKSEGVRAFLCEEGQDSLFLVSSVSENRDQVFKSSEPATKGAPVTAENLTDFYVSAYIDSELKYFELVHVDESDKTMVEDKPVYTLDYYWPSDDTDLDFYACNFNPTLTTDPIIVDGSISDLNEFQATLTKGSSLEQYNYTSIAWDENLLYCTYNEDQEYEAQFLYSLPESDGQNDAANQPDYVFAITQDRSKEQGVVPLRFAHCFSAVTFRLGSAFMSPEGRQVKSIVISGVPSVGVCTITEGGEGDVMFDWVTDHATKQTYTQNISFEGDATNIENNQIINADELTFMLIPHEISEDETITITFGLHAGEDSAHDWVVQLKIRDLFADDTDPEWLAGKRYTYTIVSEEKVDIEVTDKFVSSEPMVKGDLEITNRGNAPVYVRAYIVGWWENEDGDVVSPWLSTDGTWGGASWEAGSSKWVIGPDGFFYYTEQLQPGATTEKLFETYTLNDVMAPVVGARLILNIATQAVVHYYVDNENIWPGVPSGTYKGKYMALSPGHEIIYATLVRSGLLKGENAIYRVSRLDDKGTVDKTDDEWTVYSELLLFGPEDALTAEQAANKSVSKRIALYSGTWKVEETSWAWTYDNKEDAIIHEITGSSSPAEKAFVFNGTKLKETNEGYVPAERYGESVVRNDFGSGTSETDKGAPASENGFETITHSGVSW